MPIDPASLPIEANLQSQTAEGVTYTIEVAPNRTCESEQQTGPMP